MVRNIVGGAKLLFLRLLNKPNTKLRQLNRLFSRLKLQTAVCILLIKIRNLA